jgi:hypothetical protein
MSHGDHQLALSTAMMEHIAKRSVALVWHGDNHLPRAIASGTCVEIGGRHFISTAAHNLFDEELSKTYVFPIFGDPRTRVTQTPHLVGWGRRGGGTHDPVDVAWLEIHARAVPDFISSFGRTFVTLDRLGLGHVTAGTELYVFGMPWDYTRPPAREPSGVFFGANPLAYLTRTIEVQSTGTVERDLYADYRTHMNTEAGVRPLPNPSGLSGSGLWTVTPRPDGIWGPDQAKLVAIDICRNVEGDPQEYIRGSLIGEWLRLLRDDIPELAEHIDPVLESAITAVD